MTKEKKNEAVLLTHYYTVSAGYYYGNNIKCYLYQLPMGLSIRALTRVAARKSIQQGAKHRAAFPKCHA